MSPVRTLLVFRCHTVLLLDGMPLTVPWGERACTGAGYYTPPICAICLCNYLDTTNCGLLLSVPDGVTTETMPVVAPAGTVALM